MIIVEENGGITLQGDALFRITGIVIQAFAALLALVGMFAVYKMQVVQNEISQLELLKNERLFQKKNDIDQLKLIKKQIKYMKQFKKKAAQQKIEEIQKIHVQELEMDYGRMPSEKDLDSIMYINEEFLTKLVRQLQQFESKKEELTRLLDNIENTIEKTEHDISKKERKILQIRKETKQTMKYVLIFLIFCLPILPLSSFEIINSLFRGYVSIFLMSLIILLSILVLLSIFRTLRAMI